MRQCAVAAAARHCDGVSELCALSAYDGASQPGIPVADDAAAVTAGTAIPEDYLVLRDNLDDTDRQVLVQRQAGTATSERFSLSESTVRAIATTMLAVEGEFHCPLEIEWLIDPAGALYLLQARPAPRGAAAT